MNTDDTYKGMSHDAEEAYNKRQAEPLFKKAADLIPMEQTKLHYESLVCGYRKRDGCQVLVRDKSFYACLYHQTIKAVGIDFFTYYNLLNDNEMAAMNEEQHATLEKQYRIQQKWLKDFSPSSEEIR